VIDCQQYKAWDGIAKAIGDFNETMKVPASSLILSSIS